jgi:Clr5 domain
MCKISPVYGNVSNSHTAAVPKMERPYQNCSSGAEGGPSDLLDITSPVPVGQLALQHLVSQTGYRANTLYHKYELNDVNQGLLKSLPSQPPTAADWSRFREIFKLLYQLEERPLREVRQIMKERYQFHAT